MITYICIIIIYTTSAERLMLPRQDHCKTFRNTTQFFIQRWDNVTQFGGGIEEFFVVSFVIMSAFFKLNCTLPDGSKPLTENHWLIFSKVLSHSYQDNFTRNTQAINQLISIAMIYFKNSGPVSKNNINSVTHSLCAQTKGISWCCRTGDIFQSGITMTQREPCVIWRHQASLS